MNWHGIAPVTPLSQLKFLTIRAAPIAFVKNRMNLSSGGLLPRVTAVAASPVFAESLAFIRSMII